MMDFTSSQDGDVYYNPVFGDLWLVDGKLFVKINCGFKIPLDDPIGFIKVGHIEEHIEMEVK